MSYEPPFNDDAARLRHQLAQCREELAVALDDVERFSEALAASHERIVELSRRIDEAALLAARNAEGELAALMATKSYRLLRWPRRAWAALHGREL